MGNCANDSVILCCEGADEATAATMHRLTIQGPAGVIRQQPAGTAALRARAGYRSGVLCVPLGSTPGYRAREAQVALGGPLGTAQADPGNATAVRHPAQKMQQRFSPRQAFDFVES